MISIITDKPKAPIAKNAVESRQHLIHMNKHGFVFDDWSVIEHKYTNLYSPTKILFSRLIARFNKSIFQPYSFPDILNNTSNIIIIMIVLVQII